MTEVQPELIICYLGLKFNTYDNFEPYYFDADSVMAKRLILDLRRPMPLQPPSSPASGSLGTLYELLVGQQRSGCTSGSLGKP